MSEELPQGWAEAQIAEVCTPVLQRGPSKEAATFAYIDLGAIDNRTQTVIEARTISTATAPSRAKQNVKSGDVLFSNVRVYLENIAFVPNELDGSVASTAFSVLRPALGVVPRYLYYFVTSKRFIRAVNELARGNSPPSVQDGDVRIQTMPIAPQAEQQRIVSKIEELFSSIDEGERALERVRKLVERYRQSVLKAAVSGELTREWRERHAGELESGEALLTRILDARREAWETAELAKKTALKSRPANNLWKKQYKRPTVSNGAQHCELPSGWTWATLPMLCAEDSINGISVKGTNAPPGVAALRLDAITANGFDYSAIRYIPIREAKAARLSVCTGDFFVSRANGSIRLVGKAVLANQPPGMVVFPDTMIRYRLLSVPDLRSWLQMVWPSRLIRSQIEGLAKTTAGIHKISQGDIGQIAIPVPPLEEQEEIRSLVELRLSQADRLLQEAEDSLKLAKSVRHGTLKSAFTGQLVPQDSIDEPASVLLERLAALRSATSSEMRTAKKGQGKRGVPAGLTTRGTSTRKGKA